MSVVCLCFVCSRRDAAAHQHVVSRAATAAAIAVSTCQVGCGLVGMSGLFLFGCVSRCQGNLVAKTKLSKERKKKPGGAYHVPVDVVDLSCP